MKTKYFIIALFSLVLVSASSAYSQTKTPKVTDRQVNQQKRIAEGIKSGELTKREVVQLEKQQLRIQKNKMKAKSDGVVTPKEKAKLHAQQNKASKNIYKKKHNGKSR